MLLGFLAQVVHPVVQPDADRAREIVDELNRMLAPDGWMLKPHGETDAVEHPLENRHGATRIWPVGDGETVDIGSLPYASLKVGWTPMHFSGDIEILRELLNP